MIWAEVFDAISRSLPSRKESVEAFGVTELSARWSCICGRFRRWPMHEAEVESTVGGRRWLLELVLKRRALSSRISDRRAAASICSEMETASFWSLLKLGLGSSCNETLDCC